jgi:YCII-related domain
MAQYLLAIRYAGGRLPPAEFGRLRANRPSAEVEPGPEPDVEPDVEPDIGAHDAGVFVFHGSVLPEAATVVRQCGDDYLITDGPYSDIEEHLAGFWVLDVADLDAALEWAKLFTVAHGRPIEVLPFDMRDIDELLAGSDAGQLSAHP